MQLGILMLLIIVLGAVLLLVAHQHDAMSTKDGEKLIGSLREELQSATKETRSVIQDEQKANAEQFERLIKVISENLLEERTEHGDP